MKHWEYKEIAIDDSNKNTFTKDANSLGQEGWEIVSVNIGRAFFKREISESQVLDFLLKHYKDEK